MRVHAVHREFDELDLAAVRDRRQLDDGVQRNLQVRQLACRLVEEVREDASEDRLVRHHQHVSLPLQLHHHRLKADHDVLIRLATRVAISELVGVARLEVVWMLLLDLLVRHLFADALRMEERES